MAGDKFIPEMHLKQPGLTHSTCGPFTKKKNEFKNLCKQEIQITFTRMTLIKLAFKIGNNPKYDGYQRGLASIAYRFFNKKNPLQAVVLNLCQINNLQMKFINH